MQRFDRCIFTYIILYISINRFLLIRLYVRHIIDVGQSIEVGPLFVIEGRDKPMSVYEIIMLLLQVITVVIAFGALIALICLTKDKQPFISTNLEISIKRKGHFSKFYVFRDEPDGTTRLTIYLYYRDKDIYRQIEINLINTKYIHKTYTY